MPGCCAGSRHAVPQFWGALSATAPRQQKLRPPTKWSAGWSAPKAATASACMTSLQAGHARAVWHMPSAAIVQPGCAGSSPGLDRTAMLLVMAKMDPLSGIWYLQSEVLAGSDVKASTAACTSLRAAAKQSASIAACVCRHALPLRRAQLRMNTSTSVACWLAICSLICAAMKPAAELAACHQALGPAAKLRVWRVQARAAHAAGPAAERGCCSAGGCSLDHRLHSQPQPGPGYSGQSSFELVHRHSMSCAAYDLLLLYMAQTHHSAAAQTLW